MKSKLMMIIASFGLLLVISYIIFVIFVPGSPMKTVSNAEILTKASFTDKVVTHLGNEGEYSYYITKTDNGAFKQKAINFMKQRKFSYLTQEGAGLFFEKKGKKIILTTQMWTRKYVILKIPIQSEDE